MVARLSGLGVTGWQNPLNPYDVNGDGHGTPQAVLLLINEINRDGGGPLAPRTPEQPGPSLFLDVTGSGTLVPNDVLQVINHINRSGDQQPTGTPAEGEPYDDRGSLPDWESLLDDPATDLVDLDAYFAALASTVAMG